MGAIFGLLRPKQWIKNVFVLGAIIFAGRLGDALLLGRVLLGFGIFCLVSGCVYIFNDLVDYEADSRHPAKRHRPIASGAVSLRQALGILFLLMVTAVLSAACLSLGFLKVVLVYWLLNLFYCLYAKQAVILDVVLIALGFVLRAAAGSFLIGESFLDISPWFLICTFFLALFLALSKRRAELVQCADKETRSVLRHYSLEMVNNFLSVISSVLIISYSLYTFTCQHSGYLVLTIPLVIYGLFRYCYLLYSSCDMEAAELVIWQDKPLLLTVVLWILTCIIIIYFA